jgi:hypothetical protein
MTTNEAQLPLGAHGVEVPPASARRIRASRPEPAAAVRPESTLAVAAAGTLLVSAGLCAAGGLIALGCAVRARG